MPQITRKLEFDAAHRVLGHEGKCAHLHGHRYVAEITVSALGLDTVSRVIDFSQVKKLVGGWIDRKWDHNIILNSKDPLLKCWESAALNALHEPGPSAADHWREEVFGGKEPYVLHGINPTAEVMSEHLFGIARELLAEDHLTVERVRLYETPNCWADYCG